MSNVVELKVPPKVVNKKYKNHAIKITYLPPTRKWKWEVEYVHKSRYGDEAKTLREAHKEAEKHIDHTLKLRGAG